MKTILIAALGGMLLVSCTLFPIPSRALTPFPTLTPRVFDAPVASEQFPATLVDTPTSMSVILRDDFNLALSDGWDWHGSELQNLSLTAQHGSVMLNAVSGYASDLGKSSLLLRPAPQGDFEIETRLAFTPTSEPQFAGLVIFESRNQYLQAGRGYCRSGPQCTGRGLYFDEFIDARPQSGRIAIPYRDSTAVYLRIERHGSRYAFFASPNDVVWQPIGERESDIQPAYVGIFAGQNEAEDLPAFFDYFQIGSLPSGAPAQ